MLRVAVISVHTCPLARLGSKETGGMNVYVRELSRHLGARGAAIDVFTRRQDSGTPEVVEFGENVRVIHLPAGPASPADKYDVVGYLPEFARGVADFERSTSNGYHLVHAHYWLSAPVAIALAHRWDVPLVTMFHTLGRMKNRVSENGQEREQASRMEIEQAAMQASDLVVAASPADMDQMVDHYGVFPGRVRVVPGGVDSELFRPLPRDIARGELGMGPEKQLLFVGRIQQLKGLHLLIPAFARLISNWSGSPTPRLTIVGGGKSADESDSEVREAERLRRLAAEMGVDSLVDFAGAVPHGMLPLYYSAADVVAVPSLYESFGLVALEAMACGAPVVASRVGGLQWTVRHGESGFLVPPTKPEAFSSALGLLLRDDALRAEMSRGAVRLARRFSWEVAAERTLQLYGELVPALSDSAVSMLSP
jgi:D-inositol-3-phosphate glycosyltransferase